MSTERKYSESQASETIAFNRSKIYENLDYQPSPPGYNEKISWVVQQQIAATNGVHYTDRVGKLGDYPRYSLPVENVNHGLFLDIGCGWGRWLAAADDKGYIPIGIDIRLEFAKASLATLKAQKKKGYVVVADLENIPFKDNLFDLIWSFSVIQHTHYKRLISCLNHINRLLSSTGFTKLEFPNKNGIHNRRSAVPASERTKDDYNSWSVRYYTIDEYKTIFTEIFSDFQYENHSFLGIGVLKEDIRYVSIVNKIKCSISLLLSLAAKAFPSLTRFSDSLYITASKAVDAEPGNRAEIEAFLESYSSDEFNNLDIVSLLRCPITFQPVRYDEASGYLINNSGTHKYPVIDNIPILIASECLID